MNAPFSTSDFLDVFARYNEATWPAAFILIALALSSAAMAYRQRRHADRWAGFVLAMLWGWSGIGYHLAFFADLNPPAIAFGLLFVAQAVAFFRRGVLRHQLVFNVPLRSARGVAGCAVMAFALAGYPLASAALGHRWPHAPMFGAPCPVDLFTLGLLLWTKSPVPRSVLAIPLGWAVVATVGAWEFGMHEDWGLTIVAVVAGAWLLPRRREARARRLHARPDPVVSHRIWKHVSRS